MNIRKCKYAFDKEDEYCSECNGVTILLDGQDIPATDCQGYEPEEVKETAPPKQTKSEKVVKQENVQNVTTPEPEKASETATKAEIQTKKASTNTYIPQGVTTVIRAESGVSLELKSKWYKFNYAEERIIPETADIEQERKSLWNDVNGVVDLQVEEILELVNVAKG